VDIIQVERISMTAKEKYVIETILVEVGLESLYDVANDQDLERARERRGN